MTEEKKQRDWTAQQREVLDYRGDGLIVSAGAGSGKTTVMLERIVRLLTDADAPADLRRMLVCTFTNASAADMRRKLTETLSERLSLREDERLRDALRVLPSADIGTLHAFCAHTVRRWFFDCDVDPEFAILEEGEADTLLASAAESVIEAALAEGDEVFLSLYDAMYANRNDGTLRKAVLQVCQYARACAEDWQDRTARSDDAAYRASLEASLARDARVLAAAVRATALALRQAGADKDAAFADKLVDLIEAGEPFAGSSPQCKQDAPYRDLHDVLLSHVAAYKKILERRENVRTLAATAPSLPFCRCLAALARKTEAVYAEYKRARSKLDYADLEHGMLRVLQGEHGKEVAAAYDYVFVDEYQDINPLQEKILSYFSHSKNFYVGDLKQSIYGFRMCRPRYFAQKYKAYARGEGGAAKLLTANFRSHEGILDFVNGFFSSVMTEQFGGTTYADETLTAGKSSGASVGWKRGDPLPESVRATIVAMPKQKKAMPEGVYSAAADEGRGTEAAILLEAEAVVREIQEILDDETACVRENGMLRRALPRDIAVLVRSRKELSEVLERLLREQNLPLCRLDDACADDYPSVSALVSMLRLLDNGDDDVSLAAVLRSPMFYGYDTDALVAMRRGREGNFFDAVRAAATENAALRATLAELDALRVYAAAHTVAETAGHITSAYKCFAAALRLGGTPEAEALDAYIEHLASMTDHDDLHGYLRYVARVGLPKLSAPQGDGIRLTTIHAAKGLEYPFVILPQLDVKFNFMDARDGVLCDDEEGIVLRTFDFADRCVKKNYRYAAVAERIVRATAEEELRILYVAMTRAQNRLSLYSLSPFDDEEQPKEVEASVRYIDWLYPYLRRSARILGGEVTKEVAPEAVDSPSLPMAESAATRTRDGACNASELAFVERLRGCLTPDTSPHYPVKTSVSGVVRKEEEDAPHDYFARKDRSDDEGEAEGDDRAAARGSAYHLFMQWVCYAEPFDASAAFDTVAARFPASAALVDREQIEKAYCAMRDLIGGAEYYREKSFVLEADAARLYGDDAGKEKTLVQGVVDLMIVRDGAVTLVDYKTGDPRRLSSPAYARQMRWYAEAVRSILHMPICAAYLYGFSDGKFHKIDV